MAAITISIECEALTQLVLVLKEIVHNMAITQTQLDELKARLDTQASSILTAIQAEREQVTEAVGMLKGTIQDLTTRISELETQHGLTLDFSEIEAKFEKALSAMPDIYSPDPLPPEPEPEPTVA